MESCSGQKERLLSVLPGTQRFPFMGSPLPCCSRTDRLLLTGCGDRLLSSALRTMALEEIKKKNEELKKEHEELKKENEELKKEFEDIMKNTSFVIKWDELLKGF